MENIFQQKSKNNVSCAKQLPSQSTISVKICSDSSVEQRLRPEWMLGCSIHTKRANNHITHRSKAFTSFAPKRPGAQIKLIMVCLPLKPNGNFYWMYGIFFPTTTTYFYTIIDDTLIKPDLTFCLQSPWLAHGFDASTSGVMPLQFVR